MKTRVCPALRCMHHKERQLTDAFPRGKGHRFVCNDCRRVAEDEGTLGRVCLVCDLPFPPERGSDTATCAHCRYHLDRTSGSAWLVTSAPTDEGALWRGRYLPEASFKDSLADAVFEPGTIVEHYNEWIYQGAYRIVGAQSLAPGEMEPQQLVISPTHRPRGDRRIFRP